MEAANEELLIESSKEKEEVKASEKKVLEAEDETELQNFSDPTRTSSSSTGLFYAVRRGRSVNFCIFLQWDDCQKEVEGCETADYLVFDFLQDAVNYVKPFPDWQPPPRQQQLDETNKNRGKRKSSLTAPSATFTSKTSSKKPEKMLDSGGNTAKNKTAIKQASSNKAKKISTDDQNDNLHTRKRTKTSRNRYYKPLHEILLQGYLQNREKGFRAKELGLSFRGAQKKTTQERYLRDLAELRGYIAAAPPPTTTTNSIAPAVANAAQSSAQHNIQNPHSIIYLNYSWGVNRKYHNDLEDKLNSTNSTTTTEFDRPTNKDDSAFTSCTIENREAARMRYTAKKLFLNHRVEELTNESKLYNIFTAANAQAQEGGDATGGQSTSISREKKRKWHEQAKQEWEQLSTEERRHWEERERQHDLQQPFIKGTLIESLKTDPKRAIAKLVEDIGYWCGKTTVAKWRLEQGDLPNSRQQQQQPQVPRLQPYEHYRQAPNTFNNADFRRQCLEVTTMQYPRGSNTTNHLYPPTGIFTGGIDATLGQLHQPINPLFTTEAALAFALDGVGNAMDEV